MSFRKNIWITLLFILFLTACSQFKGECYSPNPVGLSKATEFAEDDQLPFRFPLDVEGGSPGIVTCDFCTCNRETESRYECHAAEDFTRPAGTPVYAMADGEVSFSGPMGGYGWLVIIDHPQVNLYSLYGHLSPSRWYIRDGAVSKGDLIAYLGDPDENGGSVENPLNPHLHFGVRQGQRADYPGKGEWRWMGGWIQPCPSEMGWLQPSAVIYNQGVQPGGYQVPPGHFWAKWRAEIILFSIYLFGGVFALIYAIKKNKPFNLLIFSLVLLVGGWIFLEDSWRISYGMFSLALVLACVGVYLFLRDRGIKQPVS